MLLLVSTIAILIAVAFLAMLWQYGWDQPSTSNRLAHAIASAGWIVKATTLSAVVLRLAVAVQAGVCTSLAAALLLEGNGVPLPDVLHFATLRSVSTAPPTILFPISRRPRLYIRSLPAILIVIVFLTATACQLASTILVSDIEIGTIEGPNREVPGVLGTDTNNSAANYARSYKIDYWGSRPLLYAPFGESSEPGLTVEHAHDTGLTYQGMIPFQNTTARALRRFEGLTNVFGSRVGCVAPKIEATVQYHPDYTYRYLVGNATYSTAGKGLLSCSESNETATSAATTIQETCAISFNCTIPFPNTWLTNDFSGTSNDTITMNPPPVDEWRLGICAIHEGSRWHFEKSLNTHPYAGADDVGGLRTDVTMILNHTDHIPTGSASQPNNGTTFSVAASLSGEWATYDLLGDGMVDLSLCFTELNAEPRRVVMTTQYDLFEAEVRWDSERRNYDTWLLQNRFNTSGKISWNSGRGVMDMQLLKMSEDESLPGATSLDFASIINPGLYKFSKPGKAGTYIPVCLLCEGDEEMTIKVHPVTTSLFYDIITSTRHPALGLQAIFSTLIQSAYYEELPSYDVSAPVHIRRSQIVEYPWRWLGFFVVVLMLFVHLVMVGLMVLLFAKRTKESLIGELWHSVGQVMSDVPERLLNEHVGRTEDEIRAACRTSGLDKSIVGLSHSPRVGAMELRERL